MNARKIDAIPLHVPMQNVVLNKCDKHRAFVRLNKDHDSAIATMSEELAKMALGTMTGLPCAKVVPAHHEWCNEY